MGGAPAWVTTEGTRPMWEFTDEGGGHRASGAWTELGMQRMAWSMGRWLVVFVVWQTGGGAVFGYEAVSMISSRFTSCYASGGVSAWLAIAVMVHGAVRVGCHACMYIHVVVLAVIAQPT